MSPAKRKVAVSARAGAKKRLQKGRGKARPVARKARSSVAACDMPVAKLAAAFDRPEGAEPLLSHVPGCGACTTSLTVLAASKQGLKHLTADGTGTAVERVLARGQAQGRRKLADLVYELTKASLVVLKDVDRRLHLARKPRDQALINGEMRGVVARLPQSERRAVGGLPNGTPSEDQAMIAAESCIKILAIVEGETSRQRLSRAVWLICAMRPSEAQRELEHLLEENHGAPTTHYVYWNLLWALNAQKKYSEVLERGETALRRFSGDRTITYNLCVASACLGRRALFDRFAKELRATGEAAERIEIDDRLLQFEAPQFAEKLGINVGQVERAFGLALSNGAA
jgi:hypothetical protein